MQQNFPSDSPFLGEEFIYTCTAILFLQFMQARMRKGTKVQLMLIQCSYKNILDTEYRLHISDKGYFQRGTDARCHLGCIYIRNLKISLLIYTYNKMLGNFPVKLVTTIQ